MICGAVQQAPADYATAKAALAHVREDRVEQVDQLNLSIALYPDAAEPWYRRGLAWMEQWRADLPVSVQERLLKKALVDFQQAVALQPTRYLYPLGLADAYDALHQEKEARAAIDIALKHAPMHEQARLGLAIHYHRWQHFDKAEQAYLWCREAHAPSLDPNQMRWYDGYMQLMEDAARAAQVSTTP
jgi:tetratricopeptide (TPR) repeat protein